jgi:hypothetical protein
MFVLSVAFGGAIKDGSLAAYSNGTNVVVRWVSEEEAGVKGYVIERKAGMEGPFALLTNPPIAPTGNGSSYEFEDNSAFRVTDNIYQYRITAIGTGAVYYVSVNHSVSGVRRTWGSIKAMFR